MVLDDPYERVIGPQKRCAPWVENCYRRSFPKNQSINLFLTSHMIQILRIFNKMKPLK